MNKIFVNIISGFLGSGKTTAIIKLFSQKRSDENWAIVVNEFGKISIDGQTLRSESAAGSVFEINGGCICCSAKIYLYDNLKTIIAAGIYHRILIEPSGLGGIEMVTDIVNALPDLELMPVICMVDITGLENPRLQQNMIFKAQINKSDRIVFSKCDLITDKNQQDQLVLKFKSGFPDKPVFMSGVSLSLLNPSDRDKTDEQPVGWVFTPIQKLTDNDYIERSFLFGYNQVVDLEKLKSIFSDSSSVLRAKGYIRTKTGRKLVNYTLSGFSDKDCNENQINQFVVIFQKAENLLIDEIAAKIEACAI